MKVGVSAHGEIRIDYGEPSPHKRFDLLCGEPCCVEKRELADAWQMLIELYRVLVLAGAGHTGVGSAQTRHTYSFNRRTQR